MICFDCRIAGAINAEGRHSEAAVRHGLCEDCPCQHKTGIALAVPVVDEVARRVIERSRPLLDRLAGHESTSN